MNAETIAAPCRPPGPPCQGCADAHAAVLRALDDEIARQETAPLLRARAELAQKPFWCIGHPKPLRSVP